MYWHRSTSISVRSSSPSLVLAFTLRLWAEVNMGLLSLCLLDSSAEPSNLLLSHISISLATGWISQSGQSLFSPFLAFHYHIHSPSGACQSVFINTTLKPASNAHLIYCSQTWYVVVVDLGGETVLLSPLLLTCRPLSCFLVTPAPSFKGSLTHQAEPPAAFSPFVLWIIHAPCPQAETLSFPSKVR